MKTKLILFLLAVSVFSCNRKEENAEFIDDNKSDEKETNTQENDSEQNKSTENEYPIPKPVAVISPLEAGEYIGKTVTVKGFIADVFQNEKVGYLNFVEKFPKNPFSAVVFSKSIELFDNLEQYNNKNVEVTGLVSVYKNKPQIILKSKSQIKIIG